MSCSKSNRVCDRLIISQNIEYSENVVTINIPTGDYTKYCNYCLLIAQPIPDTATIGSTVVITIGTNTTTYPLVNCNCSNVNVCQLRYRKKYPVVFCSDVQNGTFKLINPRYIRNRECFF